MAAPRLTLVARKPAEELEHLLDDQVTLQQRLFASRGVILPKITYRQSADVGAEEVELRLDDRVIGHYSSWMLDDADIPGLFLGDLEMTASAFVVPTLVEHYLQTLTESYPDLVRSAREAFTANALTEQFARRVEVGASIRDVRGVLEELLQGVA